MERLSIRDAAYARYRETQETHVTPQGDERMRWMERVAAPNLVPHIRGDSVLEIGCGSGDLLAVLSRHHDALGTDLSPANIAHCRARGLRVFQLDVFAAPTDWCFDSIIMAGVIEHFRKDELLHVLRTCERMLYPGGRLIVSTQNMDSALGVHYRYMDITHELGFTRESLAQVGRLAFAEAAVYPWVEPDNSRWVERVIRRVYRVFWRAHVRLVMGSMIDSWYDVHPGIVGVFTKAGKEDSDAVS